MPTRRAPTRTIPRILWIVPLLPILAAAEEGATVRDVVLEVDAEGERVLIQLDAPVEPRLIEIDPRNVMVALPGTSLDPTAPTLLSPVAQGSVVRVTAFDRARPDVSHEVRVVVQRRPGAAPRLTRSGSRIALEFEPLPRLASPPEATLSLANRRVPVKRILTEVARADGATLVFDEAIAGLGVVTIEGPGRFTHDEAWAIVDAILLLKGYARIPTAAGAQKVVEIAGASSPWTPDSELERSDALVTTLVRLETVVAAEIVTLLTPYLGSYATAVAFEPTNSVILAGPSSRLIRIRDVLLALDRIESGVPVFWTLRNADPEATVEQLQEILGERELPMALADARTNMLMLRVHPGSLARARDLVDRLDRPSAWRGELEVVPLRYADPQALADQLTTLRDDVVSGPDDPTDPLASRGGLRGIDFDVVADPPTRSLVVRTAPEHFDVILDTIQQLDRMPPSVRLEVMVATLTLDDRLDLGVDAFIPTLTNPKAADDLIATVTANPSGGGVPTATGPNRPFIAAFTRAPLLISLIDPISGLPVVIEIPRENFVLSMNGRTVETDTLLRPTLLVVSGEEHELFSGDNVPVRTAQTAGTGEGGGGFGQVRQDIERYDVGTTLRVLPTVGAEGSRVTLELEVQVSTLEESQAGSVDVVGPSIREIEVQSTVRLRHGEVAVIASDAEPVTTRSETGTPWLKDIPILGYFFRSTTEETTRRHLLISVQAEVLRPETRELARALAEQLGPLDLSELDARR